MAQLSMGIILAAFATKRGYDERQLATAFGLPQESIRSLGGTPVAIEQAHHLCRALDIDFADLEFDLGGGIGAS